MADANPPPMPPWLAAAKARADRGDRPADKAFGRWLGDFLDQPGDSGLLEAEEGLLLATRRGDGYTAPEAAPAIRPGFLRFLILNGDETASVPESGVQVTGAKVDGDIDLRGARCVGRVALIDCRIAGELQIEDATLGILFLDGTQVGGVGGNRATFSGSVFLQNGFRSTGTVTLFGATIAGSLQAGGAAIIVGEDKKAVVCTGIQVRDNVLFDGGFRGEGRVWLNRAKIGGVLRLAGADIIGGVVLTSATIGGDLDCSGANLVGSGADGGSRGLALDASSAKIGRSVLLTPRGAPAPRRFSAVGGVGLTTATIEEAVLASGALIDGTGGFAVDLSAAHVKGSASFDQAMDGLEPAQRFEAKGFADLRGAIIDGDLSLAGADVAGGLFLSSAKIGRDLVCTGATLTGSADDKGVRGVALDAVSARIGGTTYLDQAWLKDKPAGRFAALGQVNLSGVTIDVDLLATGGLFDNAGGALILDWAKVTGQVRLAQAVWRFPGVVLAGARFEARGLVSLYGASIQRHLDCEGGLFDAQPTAINAEIAQIGGCVFLMGPNLDEAAGNSNLAAFESRGQVMLHAARIDMQLICLGAVMTNAAPDPTRPGAAAWALYLGAAHVGYEMALGPDKDDRRAPARFRGSISLSGAAVGGLNDREFITDDGPETDCFPGWVAGPDMGWLRCEVVLDGFTYDRLSSDADMTFDARRAWLMRQPPRDTGARFLGQPFDRLAATLDDMGHGGAARDIRILKEDRITGGAPLADKLIAAALLAVTSALLWKGYTWPALGVVIAAMVVAVRRGPAARSGEWLWRRMFGWVVAYGFRPGRGVAVALVMAIVCGAFYQQAEADHALGRPKSAAASGETALPFHPYVYSLDVMLPVAKLGEAEAWKPTGAPVTLRDWRGRRLFAVDAAFTQKLVWLETAFGWLAGGILAAMASGLIRKGGKDG